MEDLIITVKFVPEIIDFISSIKDMIKTNNSFMILSIKYNLDLFIIFWLLCILFFYLAFLVAFAVFLDFSVLSKIDESEL